MNNDNIVNVAMDKDYYAQVMSGGGSGGGSGITYYDISKIEEIDERGTAISVYFKMFSIIVKYKIQYNEQTIIQVLQWGVILANAMSADDLNLLFSSVASVGLSLDLLTVLPSDGTTLSVKKFLITLVDDDEDRLNKILEYSQITEEQFYNLNE